MHHHRRSAADVNQVRTKLRQLRRLFLVVLQHIAKLLLGSGPDPDRERNYSDPFGKQANKIF
jgi:hypothetical protein